MKKIVVDAQKCIGCGLCVSIAAKSFKMNDSFKCEALPDMTDKEEVIKDAISSCPTSAISEE